MSRANLVFLARVFEKCRKTTDLWNTVVKLAAFKDDFAPQERSLFAGAFKGYCTQRKMNLRDCNQIQKIQEKEKKQDLAPLKEFRNQLIKELKQACHKCFEVVSNNYKSSPSAEAQITKEKLLADAYKFLYQVESGDQKKRCAQSSHNSYESAFKKAQAKLKTTHPIRLGLALAFSVFYDSVFRDTISACQIAKKAYDQGSKDLDERDKEIYQDASALLNMLKENLQFWTSQLQKNIA